MRGSWVKEKLTKSWISSMLNGLQQLYCKIASLWIYSFSYNWFGYPSDCQSCLINEIWGTRVKEKLHKIISYVKWIAVNIS